MEQTRLLTARRAYEFKPDQIRLTILTDVRIQQMIAQRFSFQANGAVTPGATFGVVPPTLPPGLVFQLGNVTFPDQATVPVRFLHIEQQRIVFDIAGSSDAVDIAYEQLHGLLSQIVTPDGLPVLGEIARIRDYSEITAKFAFAPEDMLSPQLRIAFGSIKDEVNQRNGVEESTLVPTLFLHAQAIDSDYAGTTLPLGSDSFQFDLRAGYKAADRIYLSTAPLTTQRHLAYLIALETALSTERDRQ